MDQKSERLIIEPSKELHFTGPFDRQISAFVNLANPTNNFILFKIKTTAPKRYCVRPNYGTIGPKSDTNIEIRLQPFNHLNEKQKQKFMIQSLLVTEEFDDFNKVWKESSPDQLMDAKLRCVFDLPLIVPKISESLNDTTPIDLIKELQQYSPSKHLTYEPVAKHSFEEKPSIMSPMLEPADTVYNELQQLREENVSLRKETSYLKEQVMQLPVNNETFTPIIVQKDNNTLFYISIAIAAAIFGMLLGKYVL